MKIALLGYGKMGKIIEQQAIARNHTIITTIDNEKEWIDNNDLFLQADVAIDFSTPTSVSNNIDRCFNADIPIVVGTTAWEEYFPAIKQRCIAENKCLFFAPNFSVGVNIFFEINKKLAEFMNDYPQYNISIEETHHTQKKDAPSGTAIKIADQIIEKIKRINKWVKGETKKDNTLPIVSFRKENIPGTHIVSYKSEIDNIEIKHTAKSRIGFAMGAVIAAEFVNNKTGLYEMKDLLFNKN